MEKKSFHKLNRAAIATVLAASGVTITAPVTPTNAAPIFTDLNPQADHYAPVLELYNRGYIQGYSDGTFRPNNKVTRGQAAKMLAQALGLNIATPKKTNFTDVPSTNSYYKYIAALAEAEIISGYIDKTFRPNEPITRNQMAKIITLGYQFAQATKLTYEFNDIAEANANKYYIQTLYDLGVTKGTTPVTYSPAKPVTRGQLASFIMRAENVSAATSKVKEIGDIVGNYVYINGAKYFIDSSLRSIFNEENKAVLKGAQIDGQIVGNTLKSVEQLTIKAQGTKQKSLVFNGQHKTFAGDLIIQGNYLQFKNWHLTGNVTLAEEPPRSISLMNPLSNIRIAGLDTFSFIDWSGIGGDDENLVDDDIGDGKVEEKPSTNNPSGNKTAERMPIVEKHVDFTNCTLKRLEIADNRSYVKADNKIPHVTVRNDVRQYEVFANIGTLYIETDVHTTMYGTGDIDRVYKNSYKNLYLNIDGYIHELYIDSINGWTDLGDFTLVGTAIIPPGAMPNDVFNDFINDNDKIGDIIDGDGEDVDREPIENTIIPDYDPPIILELDSEVDGSDATFEIRSNEEGQYYYMIVKPDERPPTIRDIIENNKRGNLMEGTGDYYAYFTEKLDEETEYVIYAVVVDEAGNVSDKASHDFKTRDGTPPVIQNLTGTGLIGGTRAQVTFNPSEAGRYRYMILPAAEKAPSLQELLQQPETVVTDEEVRSGVSFIHRGLQAQSQYLVYMIMTDRSGNPSAVADGDITVSAPFWTQALDNTPPRLTKTVLDNSDITDIDREPTKVVLTFSEQLDKAIAENVKNYTLGGTGQLKDNPYKATLSADGKKVTLEIPSMAAFVNNDTLTIRIRDVEDMAGNKILDNLVTNFATFTYQSSTSPTLSNIYVNDTVTNIPAEETIPDVLEGVSPVHKNKITFRANYPGTYYYLIMPADPNEGQKQLNHYEVLFPEENYGNDEVFQNDFTLASGWGEAVEGDGAQLDRGNAFNVYYDPTKPLNNNGYYIYMVMRDRNGNYTPVQTQYFLPNKRAWEIVNFEFDKAPNPLPNVPKMVDFFYGTKRGDTSFSDVENEDFTFTFNMQFNAEMDVASVQNRANYELKGELAKYLEVKEVQISANNRTNAKLVLGYKSSIRPEDIKIADTYIAYYLEDLYGEEDDKVDLEVTVKDVYTWATAQWMARNPGELPTDLTSNPTTITLNYIDQLKPRLIGRDPYMPIPMALAYRVNDNFKTKANGMPELSVDDDNDGVYDKTDGDKLIQLPAQLQLTFSENVEVPTGAAYAEFAELLTFPEFGPGPGSTMAISKIERAKDDDGKEIGNKLVITLNGSFNDKERLELALKATGTTVVKDKANNTIMDNTVTLEPNDPSSYKAVYIYREMPTAFNYANLNGEDFTITRKDAGDGMFIYESKGLLVGLTAGYNAQGLVAHYLVGNKLSTGITAERIINATSNDADLFGHTEITGLNTGIGFIAPANTQEVFRDDGQVIYIVVTDTYGNISNVVSREIIVSTDDKSKFPPITATR